MFAAGGLKLPSREVAVGYLLQHLEQQALSGPGTCHDDDNSLTTNTNVVTTPEQNEQSIAAVVGGSDAEIASKTEVANVQLVALQQSAAPTTGADMLGHDLEGKDVTVGCRRAYHPVAYAQTQGEMMTCEAALKQLAQVEQELASLLSIPGQYIT